VKDVPSDYYRRLHAIEARHWWQVGMREITGSILGERLRRPHQSLLDAGCGTGGFLGWASTEGSFDRICGVDVSREAVLLAREAVARAELYVAPIDELPFEAQAFDLVALNDVLQHVEEADVTKGVAELRRVLRLDGALLVRTNGGRTMRRERSDWRLYDERSLRVELERGGFRILRTTYANFVLSLWGAVRGKAPKAPSESTCGIPGPARPVSNTIGRRVLAQEARYLRQPGRRLPYGHTLFALAVPVEAS
jgi:SAM-dependent methyltransferase